MSREVDERIVQMQFDNKEFENKISGTIKSLDKLNSSMNLSNSNKDLSKGLNLSGLTDAVEGIADKFSTLGVIARTTLQNIVNDAYNMGKQVVSSFTIDPVKTGFSEYETQINAVQTILANTQTKGTTLDQVNEALDELNTYADKTIYNFTEMTRNIGTFTAAGVDLDTSVAAIKGIANLAAVSGSTAQQAANGMYQLSQALAAGSVKLQDWNSVTQAGLGGENFQEELKRTARVMGIEVDEMIEKNGTFRESLKEGWLTSEVLTETLAKYTGDLSRQQLLNKGYTEDQAEAILELGKIANDSATKVKTFTQLFDTLHETAQSGWTQSWEIIIGDFEEAKGVMTTFSDKFGAMIDASSAARVSLLKDWKQLGGRKVLIEGINTAFYSLTALIKPIKDAFRTIFPKATGKQLFELTKRFKELMEKLRPSAHTTLILTTSFRMLFRIIRIGKDLFSGLLHVFVRFFNKIKPSNEALAKFVLKISDAVYQVEKYINSFGGFAAIFDMWIDAVKNAISTAKTWIINTWNKIVTTITDSEAFKKAKEAIDNFFKTSPQYKSLTDALDAVKSKIEGVKQSIKSGSKEFDLFKSIGDAWAKVWNKVKEVASEVWKFLKPIFDRIGQFFGKIFNNLKDNFKDLNGLDILNMLKTGALGALYLQLKQFVKSITKDIKGLASGVSGVLDKVGKSIDAFIGAIKAESLNKIAKSVALLAASLIAMSLVDPLNVALSTAALTAMFQQISIVFKTMGKFDAKGTASIYLVTDGFYKIAKSVAVVAAAITILSAMNPENVLTASLAIALLLESFIGIIYQISALADYIKLTSDKMLNIEVIIYMMQKISTQLIKMAVALRIVGNTPSDSILASAIALTALLESIALFIKLTEKLEVNVAAIESVKQIAKAMIILSASVALLGQLKLGTLIQGFAAFTLILTEVLGFMAAMAALKLPDDAIGKSIKEAAKGMLILAAAIFLLGKMNIWTLGQGLLAVAAGLLIFGAALKLINVKDENTADAILKLSKALIAMSVAMFILSKIPWWGLVGALAAMAGSFLLLGAAAKIFSKQSSDKLESIAKIMRNVAFAMALAGVGILAASIGLTAFAGASSAAAAALYAVISTVLSFIPLFIRKIGEGIVALVDVIGQNKEAIIRNFVLVAEAALTGFIDLFPDIVEAIVVFVDQVLTALNDNIGDWTEKILNIILQVLNALVEYIPDIVKVAVKLIADFFLAIGEALKGYDVEALKSVLVGIGVVAGIFIAVQKLSGDMKKALPPLIMMIVLLAAVVGAFWIISLIDTTTIQAIADGIGTALVGIAAAMKLASNIPIVAAAQGLVGLAIFLGGLVAILAILGGLNQIPGFSWLLGEGSKVLRQLGEAIGGFIGGVVGAFLDAATSSFGAIGQHLTDFWNNAKPFIEGMQNMNGPKVLESVDVLAGAIVALTVGEILDGIASLLNGGKSFADFGTQLALLAPGILSFYQQLITVNGLELLRLATAVAAFAQVGAGIKEGGLFGWLTGESNWTKFAEGIEQVGKGLAAFWVQVTDKNGNLKIDANGVKTAATAAGYLADLGSKLKVGGVVGLFTGETDWKKFSSGIEGLATSLINFQNKILDKDGNEILKKNVFKNALDIATDIADFGEKIKSGGISSWWDGEVDWTKFGDGLTSMGAGLYNFQHNVQDIKDGELDNGLKALKQLVAISKDVPTEGGWWDAIFGATDLEGFSGSLGTMGTGLTTFSENIKGVDYVQVKNVSSALKDLVNVSKILVDNGDDGDNLFGFANNLSSIAGDGFDSFIDALNQAAPGLKNSVTSLYSRVTKGMMGSDDGKEDYWEYKHIGETAVGKFAAGVKDRQEDNKEIVVAVFSNILSAVSDSITDKMTQAGKDAVVGFNKGVQEENIALQQEAALIGQTVLLGAMAALDEHSPSKEMGKVGNYAVIGLINGLRQYASAANASGQEIGAGVLDSVRNSVSMVQSVINDELDESPTITPVLNLSEIQNGSKQIDNILGGGYGYDVLGRTSRYMNTVYSKRNNPNKDVVAAINNLGSRMDQLETSITGMRVVLNDNTLVGKITPSINKRLGKQVILSKRGM